MTEVKANISIVPPLTLYSSLHPSTPIFHPLTNLPRHFKSLVLHRYLLESLQVLLCTSIPVYKGKRLDNNFIDNHFTAGGTQLPLDLHAPTHILSADNVSGLGRLSLPWKPNYFFRERSGSLVLQIASTTY